MSQDNVTLDGEKEGTREGTDLHEVLIDSHTVG